MHSSSDVDNIGTDPASPYNTLETSPSYLFKSPFRKKPLAFRPRPRVYKTPSPTDNAAASAKLDAQHARSLVKLRNTFDKIFERYDKPFYDFETDIVDLTTLTIIKNKGFLAALPDRHPTTAMTDATLAIEENQEEKFQSENEGLSEDCGDEMIAFQNELLPAPLLTDTQVEQQDEDYYKELYQVNVQDCHLDTTLGHQSGGEDIGAVSTEERPSTLIKRKKRDSSAPKKEKILPQQRICLFKKKFEEYSMSKNNLLSKEKESFLMAISCPSNSEATDPLQDYMSLKQENISMDLTSILENDSFHRESLDSILKTLPYNPVSMESLFNMTFPKDLNVRGLLTSQEKSYLTGLEERIDYLLQKNENNLTEKQTQRIQNLTEKHHQQQQKKPVKIASASRIEVIIHKNKKYSIANEKNNFTHEKSK